MSCKAQPQTTGNLGGKSHRQTSGAQGPSPEHGWRDQPSKRSCIGGQDAPKHERHEWPCEFILIRTKAAQSRQTSARTSRSSPASSSMTRSARTPTTIIVVIIIIVIITFCYCYLLLLLLLLSLLLLLLLYQWPCEMHREGSSVALHVGLGLTQSLSAPESSVPCFQTVRSLRLPRRKPEYSEWDVSIQLLSGLGL